MFGSKSFGDLFKVYAPNTDKEGGSRRDFTSSIETFRDLAVALKVQVPSGILVQGTKETAHASMREGVIPEVAEEYKSRGYEERPTTKEEAQAMGQNGWNGLGVSLRLDKNGKLEISFARQQEAELYKVYSLAGFKSSEFNKEELQAHSPNIGGAGIMLVVDIDGEEYIFGGRKPESFIGEKQWHPSAGPMNFDEKSIDASNSDLREMVLHTVNAAAVRGTNDFFEKLLDGSGQSWSGILDSNAFYMSDAVTGTAAIVMQIKVTKDQLIQALADSAYDSAATPLTGIKISDLKQLKLKTGDKNEEVFSIPAGLEVVEMSSAGLARMTTSDDFVVRPGAIPYGKIAEIV